MENHIDEALLDKLQQCKDLPTPPVVATKILELSAKDDSNLDTLASIVSMDPALSAKILSIANSSLYMRRVEADTVEQAVGMFGWTGTLNIALGFAVIGSIRGALTSGLDYDRFWLRSLAAATSARSLGQAINNKNDEFLFLPGLLQDIGMLALDKSEPGLYSNIGPLQNNHAYIRQLELKHAKSDHAIVGKWLLESWGLPKEITELVGLSHHSNYSDTNITFIAEQKCIYLSGYLADCLLVDEKHKAVNVAASLFQKEINMATTDFLPVLGHVATQFREMAAQFDLDLNKDDLQGVADLSSLVLLSETS